MHVLDIIDASMNFITFWLCKARFLPFGNVFSHFWSFWLVETAQLFLCELELGISKKQEYSEGSNTFGDSTPKLAHMPEVSLSRSAHTYTSLIDGEIRPSRGAESSSASACRDKCERISQQRLQNLPSISLVILQACKRLYEGFGDNDDQCAKPN